MYSSGFSDQSTGPYIYYYLILLNFSCGKYKKNMESVHGQLDLMVTVRGQEQAEVRAGGMSRDLHVQVQMFLHGCS